MSFIQSGAARGCEAGAFLESEVGLVRKTRLIKAEKGTACGARKLVPAGSLYEDGDEKGIVYEDVDVTSGDMPGSVVLAGRVYKDRLPQETQPGLEGAAGFTLVEASPATERPY